MAKEGFGRARTWKSRLDSRKLACNSMTEMVVLACCSIKGILRDAHFPNPLVSMAQYELYAPRVDPNVTIRQPATLS